MDKAMELAQAIAANAQVAVRQSKAAIRRGLQTDMYTGAAYEAEAFGLCFATEDQKDAMTAFVNKEKVAAFKNRLAALIEKGPAPPFGGAGPFRVDGQGETVHSAKSFRKR